MAALGCLREPSLGEGGPEGLLTTMFDSPEMPRKSYDAMLSTLLPFATTSFPTTLQRAPRPLPLSCSALSLLALHKTPYNFVQ